MAEIKIYENNLKLIVETMPSILSVSAGILVGAGSCLETPDNNGISHFIEHTTFKGTENLNSLKVSEAFDDVGAQVNAFTSKEMTCYYVKSTKSALSRSFEVLSDMFLNSVYEKDELDREKGVVIEEINMSYDTPEDVCLDALSEAYFGRNGLGQTILGPSENIIKFNKKYIDDYRNRYYNSDNTVISFAGNITMLEADILVKQYFLPFVSDRKSESVMCESSENLCGRIIKEKDIEQLHMAFGFSGLKYDDDKNTEMSMLNVILGSGMSSRLFQTLREKLGLCYTVYSYPSGYRNTGSLAVYAGLNSENANKAYEETLKLMKELKNGVTEQELSRAKAQILASFEFGGESSASQMMLFGKYLLFTDKCFDFKNKIDSINKITRHSLNDFINTLNFNSFSLSVIGKNANKIKL